MFFDCLFCDLLKINETASREKQIFHDTDFNSMIAVVSIISEFIVIFLHFAKYFLLNLGFERLRIGVICQNVHLERIILVIKQHFFFWRLEDRVGVLLGAIRG